MSRTQTTPDFYRDVNSMQDQIQALQRQLSQIVLKDVNTTGLTSAQIDIAVFPAPTNAQPTDGIIITDKTNFLLLVREAGKWYATPTLTLIP